MKQLFDKVSKEQNGRLDVLVNNAYKGVKVIIMIIMHNYNIIIILIERFSVEYRN